MPSRRRIPEETKAVIKVLKTTTDLTLEKIAKQCTCKVSTASFHSKCSPHNNHKRQSA